MAPESHAAPQTDVIHTHLSGYDLLLHPELNKGTAFTEEERTAFALHGLLPPPHVGTLEEQRERRQKAFGELPSSFAKYTFMRDLQDSDEVLFYSLIEHNTEDCCRWCTRPRWARGASGSRKYGASRGDYLSVIQTAT